MNRWSIADARKQFSRVIEQARQAPQEVFNRERKVAVIVSAEEYGEFAVWRNVSNAPSLAARFEDLRRICNEERYRLATAKRRDRKNALLKALDELPG